MLWLLALGTMLAYVPNVSVYQNSKYHKGDFFSILF